MSVCKACDEPLTIVVEDDNGRELHIPDALILPCNCHFHWQCFLDESTSVAVSLKCPSCEQYLPSNAPGPSSTNEHLKMSSSTPILVQYTNEGGVQNDLDILPSVTEEAFFESHPEGRPAKAIHSLCYEGDTVGVVDLLRQATEDGFDPGDLVRFQDPLADDVSALHLAVDGAHEETMWLLLWLSSSIPTESFPKPVRDVAEAAGLGRLPSSGATDVRALRDKEGKTPEDYAKKAPTTMARILETGLLSP